MFMVFKVRMWFTLLFLNVFLIIGIFKTLPREMAPKVAGSIFIAIGIAIFSHGIKHPMWRKSLIFWIGSIHLFITSLPLMILHLTGASENLLNLNFAGYSQFILLGDIWHRAAEWVYSLLILSAFIDLFRFRRTMIAKKPHA